MAMLLVFTSFVIAVFCVSFDAIRADNIENANFRKVSNPDSRCLVGSAPKLISHESECSFFYACVDGHAILKECPKNLHFNARKLVCDYPQNAGCEKGTTRNPQGRIGGKIGDIECPSENGRYSVLKSHPTDCEQYYVCDNGVPQISTCQPGLHFNPSTQACDFPESAGCDTSVPKTPREQVVDENSHLECPAKNGKVPVLKPHSSECEKFYICDNGVAHLKVCQASLHFNPKIQACDYPENAGCKADDGISKDQLSKKGRLLDDFTMSCPTVRSGVTVIVPHPLDCSKFLMCGQGQAHLRTCPSGLHFNRILQECDYPDKAKCEEMGRLLSVGLPSPFCPTISGKRPVFYGHPTNCSIYYLCSNGLAYEFVCPARLQFNLRQKICDYESVARCSSGGKKLSEP